MVEAEQSRMNMMLLYEEGFDDFSANGLQQIHRCLFGDLYEWAGAFRIINIQKREEILAGKSVWYSNEDCVAEDLHKAFLSLHSVKWDTLTRTEFVAELSRKFSLIWQTHPFREGNTRTVVMMLTFFVEHYGYFLDRELLALSAGYVRNSFVMASLDQFSEFEHLEKILLDAVCTDPIEYDVSSYETGEERSSKYSKYQQTPYKPKAHEQRLD